MISAHGGVTTMEDMLSRGPWAVGHGLWPMDDVEIAFSNM